MKRKDRLTGLEAKIFFLNQLNQIQRIVKRVDRKSHRLGTLVGWTLIALMSLFWTGILLSLINAPLLLAYPPYPESQIPKECLYEVDYIDIFFTGGEHFYIPEHYNAVYNPTYAEMKKFLEEDKTDQNEYVFDRYVCRHFARDLVWNATEKGIRAGYTRLRFLGPPGHAIACFDTIDKGLIFVEPITDGEVRIVVGKNYQRGIVGKNLWEKIMNAWSGLTNYEDAVEKVSVYWNGNNQ